MTFILRRLAAALALVLALAAPALAQSRFQTPSEQFLNANGVPYVGGQLFFYASGTSTPLATYADQGLTTPNPNPVILDGAGRAGSIFLGGAPYKVVFDDVLGNQIWSLDPVESPFALQPAGMPVMASIAALRANAVAWSTIHVQGYYGAGTPGGGDFEFVGTSCTDNGGTVIKTTTGGYCYDRIVGPGEAPEVEWFGATGNATANNACTIGASSSTLLCTGYSFAAANVGQTVACYLAGATVAGERNATLISSIASVSGGTAGLASSATNAITGGRCAWGTDDTSAINAALAATGSGVTLAFRSQGYLMSGTLEIGDATFTWAHNLVGLGAPWIYFAIPNHTADCVDVNAFTSASITYVPVRFDNFTLDCMNTGLDGLALLGGQPIELDNITTWRAWRNGRALRPASPSSNLQQVGSLRTRIFQSGLHAIYNYTDSPASPGDGAIDEIGYWDTWLDGWSYNGLGIVGQAVTGAAKCSGNNDVCLTVGSTTGYTTGHDVSVQGVGGTTEANVVNAGAVVDGSHIDLTNVTFVHAYTSGGMIAPSEQLGAAIYSLSQGSSGNSLLFRHHYNGATEINNERAQAQAYGSDVNIDAILFADGTLAHVLEGAGNASAILGAYQEWWVESPTIEDAAGTATPGFVIASETPNVTTVGIRVLNMQFSGNYDAGTVSNDISFGANCSAGTGGCGNELSITNAGSGYPLDQYGTNLQPAALQVQGAISEQSAGAVQVPASGSTVPFGCNQGTLIISGSGTLSALTIDLPDADGCAGFPIMNDQIAVFSTDQAISTLTVGAPHATVANGAPTSAGAGQGFRFIYDATTNAWYRQQ
jgi:hypothetical protein